MSCSRSPRAKQSLQASENPPESDRSAPHSIEHEARIRAKSVKRRTSMHLGSSPEDGLAQSGAEDEYCCGDHRGDFADFYRRSICIFSLLEPRRGTRAPIVEERNGSKTRLLDLGSPALRPQNILSSVYSRLSAESDSVVLFDHRTSPLNHFLAHRKALVLGTGGANSPRPQAGNRTFLVETH